MIFLRKFMVSEENVLFLSRDIIDVLHFPMFFFSFSCTCYQGWFGFGGPCVFFFGYSGLCANAFFSGCTESCGSGGCSISGGSCPPYAINLFWCWCITTPQSYGGCCPEWPNYISNGGACNAPKCSQGCYYGLLQLF
jgi:hypothetical protein